MRYLSVCSGIEAASVAWRDLPGWSPVAFAEINPFACAVLKHHYPHVPTLGDFTKIGADDVGPVDLLVGGPPCQSFSVAGKRLGMDDARGNLVIEYLRLARRLRVRYLVFENVPGLLSSAKGRDFGAFLGLLAECGFGFAYRILDASGFGVPQRRRRIFLVGCAGGDWRRAAAILFERESLRGHIEARGKARPIASALTAHGVGGGGGPDDNSAQAGHLITAPLTGNVYADRAAEESLLIASTVNTQSGGARFEDPLIVFDTTQITSGENRANPQPGNPCHPLSTSAHPPAIAFRTSPNCGAWETGERTDALTTGTDRSAHLLAYQCHGSNVGEMGTLRAGNGNETGGVPFFAASGVRRITPTEAERLMGFPDGWTVVPYRGKLAADGPRYRALGNSFAVPVVRWLGERIAMVEEIVARSNSRGTAA